MKSLALTSFMLALMLLCKTAVAQANENSFIYDANHRLIAATSTYGACRAAIFINYKSPQKTSFLVMLDTPQNNVSYTYDLGNLGIGRLTGFTDKSGSTAYTYDARGNVLTDKRTIAGRVYITAYTYDPADHVASITYPDGRTVSYARDGFGRISGVSVQNKALAANITYRPFGPVAGFTFGNGIAAAFAYDADYRLTGIATGSVQNLAMTYNGVDNITAIAGSNNQTFTYDANQRLLSAAGIYGTQAFAYDADGNRTSETSTDGKKALTSLYATPAASNRLAAITGANAQTFTYDARGNLVSSADGKTSRTYAYDARNRNSAISAKGKTVAGYTYNAMGERVIKDDGKTPTHFIYDLSGNLIAEASDGRIAKEYIYLDNLPVAMIDGNTVYYIHADHLGQPQKMTDISQKIVWDRVAEPFGETVSIKGPATLNLRFPGQYFDAESGLHYNMFRSYDSATGRYTQSDPIGLLGGINTYSYVSQNPVNAVDPSGLCGPLTPVCIWGLVHAARITAATVITAEVATAVATGVPTPLTSMEALAAASIGRAAAGAAKGEQCAGKAVTTYYPPNNGFMGQPTTEILQPGTTVGRWGYPGGKFLAPTGTAPQSLSLSPGTTNLPYTNYTVMKPLPVSSGPAAPWFGQPGGGTQYLSPNSVGWLVENGYLK